MKECNYEIMKISIGGEREYRALSPKGEKVASMVLKDGKCKGYSIVPEIIKAEGQEEGLILLLNSIVPRLKGPIVSMVRPKLFKEYGFVSSKGQYIFD